MCFSAEFEQAGNKGDGGGENCHDLEVVLVRDASAALAEFSRNFDKSFERKLGGSRIAIETSMSTQNRLDANGAFSRSEGKVSLTGKLGKSFNLTLAQAFGEASLNVDPGKTFYEVGVDAFGDRIFGISEQASTIVQSQDFSVAKSFKLGGLGFGFGPVSIGLSIGAGGTIGFAIEDTLEVLADNSSCQELLNTDTELTGCGRLSRVSGPYFGLTGTVEGGINLKIVKAAVVADLRFITTSFPLDTTLGFGLTNENRLLVRGGATWDMSLEPLGGDVSIVGKIKIGFFKRSKKINLFSFSAPTIESRLLSLSMASFEEVP